MNREEMIKMFGFSEEVSSLLDVGSSHPASCRCDVCKEWWKEVGPDEDGYGPFTKEEIEGGERKVTVIDVGREVICDGCNSDFTNSLKSGGFVVGSYCYCPNCCEGMEKEYQKYGEAHLIRLRCPEGKSFSDWICDDVRKGNNNVTIMSDEPYFKD